MRRTFISADRLIVCALLVVLLEPLSAAQSYGVTDLGTLPNDNSSEAWAMNVNGRVVGASWNAFQFRAFLWEKAKGVQDLGTLLGGGSYSFASGVNASEQVVGASDFVNSGSNSHAFLWNRQSGMQDLGTLGGAASAANAINDIGQVVGSSFLEPISGGGNPHAFLWSKSLGMQDLGTLPGGSFSYGNWINRAGAVVGYSDCSSCTGYHAFLWSENQMQDLGTLPGGNYSAGVGINDYGHVVGTSDFVNGKGWVHAFLWSQSAGMQDLGTLPGGIWSEANGVNKFDEVVGNSDYANSKGVPHAFIWTEREGMQDLNGLIPATSGWLLLQARAINVRGQIAGTGVIRGQPHAFLLTPKIPGQH
jgi:probable HAF family extracellular repeat protein